MKKMISTVVLIVLVITSIDKVSSFLQLKESDNRYSAYFVEDTQIDVLFLGSSHVRHGFFPMELWNDYGISSFNLAGNGNTISVSYWTLVNALDYQIPKVVVMDVFDMWPGRIFSEYWGQVHASLDAFPLSANKYRMVKDLFDDKELTDGNGNYIYDKRWEILWDLGEYHTRWTSLSEVDFYSQAELEENSTVWKGSSPLVYVVERNEHIYSGKTDGLYYDEVSEDYLKRIISLCEEKGITLLLINTGYDCSDEAKYFADSACEIAGQYNIHYLDFTEKNIINFESDLYSTNHNTHVNFSGAERLTSYIGAYLSENFQLQDHRTDDEYSQWWDDYQEFFESKKRYLCSQEDIIYYLMFLADDDYQTIVEIKDPSILYDNNNMAMFQNLGIDYDGIDEDCNLIVLDNASETATYFCYDNTSGTVINTVLGEVSICINDENDTYSLLLNEDELYKINTAEDEGRIRVTVLNKNTGEIVDVHTF